MIAMNAACILTAEWRHRVSEVETKYYADGENAFCMKKTFKAIEDNGKRKQHAS
jgi:hypothetical protein